MRMFVFYMNLLNSRYICDVLIMCYVFRITLNIKCGSMRGLLT
jgi:hypothetical protein